MAKNNQHDEQRRYQERDASVAERPKREADKAPVAEAPATVRRFRVEIPNCLLGEKTVEVENGPDIEERALAAYKALAGVNSHGLPAKVKEITESEPSQV